MLSAEPVGRVMLLEAAHTSDPEIVAAAYEDDPESAAAEYGAEFRGDIADFVSREIVAPDGTALWPGAAHGPWRP